MPIQDSNDRYGTVSRVLHWGMALLLVWQFLSAGAHALLSDTAVEEFFWGTHKPLGFLLFVLWGFCRSCVLPWGLSFAAVEGPSVVCGCPCLAG